MYIRTDCIVLSRKNFNEADRILTLYSREYGKISCLAKGVRRPTSRKSGHVEVGNWCKVFIAKGKNLDLLTEAELKKTFGTKDLTPQKAANIFHLLELVDQLTEINQKNREVFALLVNSLTRIEEGEDFSLISAVFKTKLLCALGFFSVANFKNSGARDLIKILEEDNFENIKKRLVISSDSYLKLLSFLDSIIESLTERKLKTARFVNGQL